MTDVFIHTQHALRNLNTLGFDQKAERFVVAQTEQHIEQAVALARQEQWPIMVIGEGSNIVVTKDVPGMVIHLGNATIEYDSKGNSDETLVTVGAGANWHTLVTDTLAHGCRGLENLSLIPGTVGAAPVQNIGAYGVEIRERLTSVRAFHIRSQQWREFSNADCDFSYRNSFFKKNVGQYIISSVSLSLGNKNALAYDYQALHRHLEAHGHMPPTAQQISDAVVSIRQSKLPDPKLIGNAGSFFHNPVVSKQKSRDLLNEFPELPVYAVDNQSDKLSAGWMIDSLGFKGVRRNGVGVYEKQALVLVHFGGATGNQLLELAMQIVDSVRARFGVELQIEPLVV